MASADKTDGCDNETGRSVRSGRERGDVLKEDILEQIVDDYLQLEGYFTIHNVRFRPRKDHPEYQSSKDSVSSDMDVLAVHPRRDGVSRVVVVSCKSWQGGFDPVNKLAELRGEKRNAKRATWQMFRELWVPKWSEAFVETIHSMTGQREFSYRIAVTHLKGRSNADEWQSDPTISANIPGCTIDFWPLQMMWDQMLAKLGTTPASSDIGRLAQLLKAGGLSARAKDLNQ